MTEEQKIELDNHLARIRVGEYIFALWRVIPDETERKQLEEWLLKNEVIEEKYAVLCPHCLGDNISVPLNKKEKNERVIHFH